MASCWASVTCNARTGTVNSGNPGMGHAKPVLPHMLDMVGPGIDESHVLAGPHHMGARVAADRPAPKMAIFFLLVMDGFP